MKIVKLKGGLGNQMFQYAFAKLIEKKTGEEVKLDYTSYSALKNDTVRKPRLERFNLSICSASSKDIEKKCLLQHQGNSQALLYKIGIYAEKTLNRKYYFEENRAYVDTDSILKYEYFDGYWQSYRYIEQVKDEIIKDFTPKTLSQKTTDDINMFSKQNSVFVGVRKGDYTKSKYAQRHFGSFSSDYYNTAMKKISEKTENPIFYIFSNDINWCKQNLALDNSFKIVYREPEQQVDDFEELMLMSSCKHAIMVNSTYHWWGAYLIKNKNKVICCPKKWFFDDKPIDIIPNDWVVIDIV